ncbi:MAG: 30S ribosome-binding factor RbfA [Actinobacteria bacterium]|jgi:ribosome-binding factor A|nr:30S ribosome-binding factor RbfA [Actinomycetota bacterium]NDA39127.1 30S ribosome-binding factor RbfA [Actinomycetota bacterium]NDE12523.1 30S ribosome-binding factor RbfA [Actinomycetota bacterium]NDE83515.1 30S ribosome-binding factor RbfA [Actinomycetota bacterium]
MGKSHRVAKVADRIKVVVAQALENRIKDPRLGFVTITDVRVTGDLQQASIFYTVLGDDEARANTAKALESAKGVLRTEVGRELGTRVVPTLTFFVDALSETAKNFEDLLDQVKKHDEEIAHLRDVAKPIGGSDPYRTPRAREAE